MIFVVVAAASGCMRDCVWVPVCVGACVCGCLCVWVPVGVGACVGGCGWVLVCMHARRMVSMNKILHFTDTLIIIIVHLWWSLLPCIYLHAR